MFLKLPTGQFRLWDEKTDPAPIYRDDILKIEKGTPSEGDGVEQATGEPQSDSGAKFAYEEHLQSFLIQNLDLLDPGLRLYEEEGLAGVEFPAGSRYVDVLAIDRNGDLVVIELKVARGYDRAVGQILRYMAWVKKNLAGGKRVRGIIVANEINEDLKLAASLVPDIKLAEYEILFRLKPVT